MLNRVLEPELMDTPAEAIDYDSMDHAEVNRAFVDDLLAAGYQRGEVLDLGTGTAQIPVALCQRNDRARVVAVDAAASMLDVARGNVELDSLTHRIMLDLVDAKALPFEDERFACVISNSIVHHIPEPAPVLAEAVRVLAPGGLLLFRDLARPDSDEEVDRLVATYAEGANEHQRQMFDDSLRAALTATEVGEMVATLGCDPTGVVMTSDRHWTWTYRKPGELPADESDSDEFSESSDEPGAPEEDAPMTAEQLAEARRYGQLDLYCDLADRAIDVGYLATMAFWAAMPLDRWLGGYALLADHATLRIAAMFLVVICGHIVVSLPLSFFSGFVLEHRFGMSNARLGGWAWRYAKRNLLAIGFGMLMFMGLYWIIWSTGGWWWLVAAVGFFLVSVILGQLAPVLILPMFYKIERLENEELSSRLARLADGTGLSIEGVYRMDMSAETSKANAMLAGLGRTRRVLLGDTVLEKFTPEEIEVIFGHEIGHHVHQHIRKMIITGGLYCAAGFWACDWLIRTQLAAHDPTWTYADLPAWTLPLLMLAITLFSMLLEPLQNIISRRYERQCDRYAIESTGLRDAYRSAFRKLAKLNKEDPHPHPVAVFLLHSHPPVAERLAMADEV
jgi:Zn-dependent protease with chaperone function/ubiquinone/menaquinone biosynthesis C-methylase UbiE